MSFISELKRRNVFRVGVAYGVVSWVLIQVVDVLAPRMALPEWVPGFVILMLVIGFPVALIFAWAYEITPEGLKKTEQVDSTRSITHVTGRKIDRAIIGGLTVLVLFLLADRFLLAPAGAGGGGGASVSDASIAVLPFANLSGDPNEDYFSDGISEELLNVLAQIPELRVAARTSSFQFKNDNRDIREIARALNVAHVLEGSVRRSDEQVRITAQLINADDGYHLWSDTYTRDGSDIFAVQDEISGEIVSALRSELGLELQASAARDISTTSQAAYEAYLRGRHLVVQRTRTSIEAAIREFEESISLDPTYAPAHAELSLAWNFLDDQQYGDLTLAEVVARSTPAAERALALDPDLAEAHAASGFVARNRNEFEVAIERFDRALEINPNYAAAHNWRGNILTDALGRYAAGLEASRAALERDPLSIPALANTMIALYDRNRVEEAEEIYGSLEGLSPSLANVGRANWLAGQGRVADAIEVDLEALELDPTSGRTRRGLAPRLAELGFVEGADAVDPASTFFHRWIVGDYEASVRMVRPLVENSPEDVLVEGFSYAAAAAVGDDRVRAGLEALWDESGGVIARNGVVRPIVALALIWARERAGDDASDVRQALRAHQSRVREAGLVLTSSAFGQYAFAEYAVGDREAALASIEAAGAGWRMRPGVAFLSDIENDPRYTDLLQRRDRLVAAERASLLARLCGVDHPASDIWTPSEADCATPED